MKINTLSIKTALMAVALLGAGSHAQQSGGRVVLLSELAQKGETARQTYDRVIAQNDYVAVKFYLPHCTPCKALAPEFAALAQKHTNILFIEIDATLYDELSNQLKVQSAPTLILYKNHKQVVRWVGGDKQRLRSEVDRLLQ